jgi:hypothetical protein
MNPNMSSTVPSELAQVVLFDAWAHRVLLLVKFAGVTAYAGGLVAALLASVADERRRAAHRVAASGLVATWASGYLLSLLLRVPLTELWILGGVVLSSASKVALVRSVARERATRGDVVAAVAPFVGTLALMVFRPTWESLRS